MIPWYHLLLVLGQVAVPTSTRPHPPDLLCSSPRMRKVIARNENELSATESELSITREEEEGELSAAELEHSAEDWWNTTSVGRALRLPALTLVVLLLFLCMYLSFGMISMLRQVWNDVEWTDGTLFSFTSTSSVAREERVP